MESVLISLHFSHPFHPLLLLPLPHDNKHHISYYHSKMDKQIECINELKQRVLDGGSLTAEEADALGETTELEALYEAAAEITHHFGKPDFNLP